MQAGPCMGCQVADDGIWVPAAGNGVRAIQHLPDEPTTTIGAHMNIECIARCCGVAVLRCCDVAMI